MFTSMMTQRTLHIKLIFTIVFQANISSFTNQDIKDIKVVYQNDDSESEEDAFTFMATPIISEHGTYVHEISEFSG